MEKYSYIIHTGLYSKKALENLQAIRYGIMHAEHRYTWFYRGLDNFKVEQNDDNEVILASSYGRPFDSSKTEQQFLSVLAYKLKEFVRSRPGYGDWNRYNTTALSIIPSKGTNLNFDVQTAYFLYDKFLRRPKFENKYPKDFVENLRSVPLDPITVEMKVSHREEIQKLMEEYDGKVSELRNQRWMEREQACKLIDEKYQKLTSELYTERDLKIAEMQKGLDEFIAATQQPA